ncbi:MAG TPA: hypothetical protein VKK79_25595 [Candidatus Lokiarchaeia archaeon]|nr:hypothetical protein [Candidatus Lokiarchaeia archaeon]
MAQPAESKEAKLKVIQVAMFKHGVSYYLLRGDVTENGYFKLAFKAKEMDDVLKSLLAIDTSGSGYISSVGYDAAEDLSHLLESISLHLTDDNVFSSLLTQLQGAKARVNVGRQSFTGTIIGLEPVTRIDGQVVVDDKQLVFLDEESGYVQKIAFGDIASFEILEDSLRGDLSFLLETLIAGKKKDSKNLVIRCEGPGDRQVLVSYIQEAPIWKTTYRLVLPDEEQAQDENPIFLSGWVICENVTEFDWDEIRISFVAGVPVSFTYPLFQAHYITRPVIQPPKSTGVAPVEIADEMDTVNYPAYAFATEESKAKEEDEYADMRMLAADKPAAPRSGASGAMHATRGGYIPSQPPSGTTAMQISTKDFGELFEYDIDTPVTIKKKQSALVPILAENVKGRKILMFQQGKNNQNPAACVEVTNSTKLTLEKGPVTVYYKDNLAGEAMMPFLNKEDTRILNYAVEQGVVVLFEAKDNYQKVHRVSFSGSYIYEYYYADRDTLYKMNNKTAAEKILYVDHPKTSDYKIRETEKKLNYKETPTTWRFELKLHPKKGSKFTVPERREISSTYYILDMDHEGLRNKIEFYLSGELIDPKQEEKLREIAETIAEKKQLQRQVDDLEAEINEITNEQSRLRQNLQVLTDSLAEKDLKEKYIQKFEAQEQTLEANREQQKQLKEQIQVLEEKVKEQMKSL